ncbi:uncharacterized protein LOC144134466 [Amblyomma americanum]
MATPPKRPRMSVAQGLLLIELLEQHPPLARAASELSPEYPAARRGELWERIAAALNREGPAVKSAELWGTSGGRLSGRAGHVVQLVGPEQASPPHSLSPPRGHRASVGSVPGTSGLQREHRSAADDTNMSWAGASETTPLELLEEEQQHQHAEIASTQQPTALSTLPSFASPPSPPVPGRPVWRRRQRDEEVADLLRETRRTADLTEARNRRDAEFQARLLEHLNEAAADRRQLTATVADLAAAVRDTREQSVRLHEQLVVAVSFLLLMLHYQIHPPPH